MSMRWVAAAPIGHSRISGVARATWPGNALKLRGRITRLAVAWVVLGAFFAGAAYWFIDARLTDLMLAQVTARAMDQVQLGVYQAVQASDFEPPHAPQKLEALAGRLDPLLARVREPDSGVLRVNVFAPDGTLVYSDVAALRGQVEPPFSETLLAGALAGRTGAEISSLSRLENSDLKPRYGEALEAYVPLTLGGRVVGAYELYADIGPLQRARPVWGILSAGLGLLCLAILVALVAVKARPLAPAATRAGRATRRESSSGEALAVIAAQRWAGLNARQDTLACMLTRREIEVLCLLAGNHTYRSIAKELVVSEETVRSHVKNILHKLKQPDRRQAVLAAVRAGVLQPPPHAEHGVTSAG